MAASQTTRKKGLADLLPSMTAPPEVTSAPAPEKPKSAPRAESKPSKAKATVPPAYMTLLRKEARLREEQVDALTVAARELNRAKPAGGERITENTLIRVAVDLLLSQGKKLEGSTETEIRKSVGL